MHKNEALPGFTKQYGVKSLVWYEQHDTRDAALWRERQMKKWNRAWKLKAVEVMNPQWFDLYEGLSFGTHDHCDPDARVLRFVITMMNASHAMLRLKPSLARSLP